MRGISSTSLHALTGNRHSIGIAAADSNGTSWAQWSALKWFSSPFRFFTVQYFCLISLRSRILITAPSVLHSAITPYFYFRRNVRSYILLLFLPSFSYQILSFQFSALIVYFRYRQFLSSIVYYIVDGRKLRSDKIDCFVEQCRLPSRC